MRGAVVAMALGNDIARESREQQYYSCSQSNTAVAVRMRGLAFSCIACVAMIRVYFGLREMPSAGLARSDVYC